MEAFARLTIGKMLIRVLGAAMESRFRYQFFHPMPILKGANILPGQAVLEVGCGTGYFTLPAAQLIGEQGRLVAIDVLSESVDEVSRKVRTAHLNNTRVVKGDALHTGFEAESFDKVLLFGEIPAPMLPLNKLLPEMHRILREEGTLNIWPSIPGWFPQSIVESGIFCYKGKNNGVMNFIRCFSSLS